MDVYNARIATPVGRARVVLAGNLVLALTLPGAAGGGWARLRAAVARRCEVRGVPERDPPARVVRALGSYFRGRLDALDALDLAPSGTDFQDAVWSAVRAIAPGATRTFGELAEDVGRPGAVRATARAVAANPIQLAIPCHRVDAAGGRIPGPNGVARLRRRLREHEEAFVAASGPGPTGLRRRRA